MKYIDLKKIIRMDYLIRSRSTGNAERFAGKVELSRSAFFDYLSYMRHELMLDIMYSSYSETYYYEGKDLCSVLGDMRCSTCKERYCLEQEVIA